MSEVAAAHPPLDVTDFGYGARARTRPGVRLREAAGSGVSGADSRVTSSSGAARRVSPSCHGNGVLQAAQLSPAASAAAPHAGHRNGGVTGRL
jgi:hypothetical protein